MSINNLPASLQAAIQQNLLGAGFEQSLLSTLVYRSICERRSFMTNIGETFTMTRAGLKAPVPTPLNPQTNTNLDNGLTPKSYNVEQFTMTLNQYGDTQDLNRITSLVGIGNFAIQNSIANGKQAAQTLDVLARDNLFNSYLGGNTYVATTLGAPGTTVSVDDIRGFSQVLNSQGQLVPVSADHPLPVVVGETEYNLIGFTTDSVNISNARNTGGYGVNGISGSLIFNTNVSVSDATIGNAVVGSYSPAILRPNARTSTSKLVAGDQLTLSLLLDAKALLESNGVPMIDGAYNLYLDNISQRQLFADPEFQLLYRGETLKDPTYFSATISQGLGMRFFKTTQAPQQLKSGTSGILVHRPILCGGDVLVEGTFKGQSEIYQGLDPDLVNIVDDVVQIIRPPVDRFQQIIAQSWFWNGGYAVPSDATANRLIIPTASNAYLKRAVAMETA